MSSRKLPSCSIRRMLVSFSAFALGLGWYVSAGRQFLPVYLVISTALAGIVLIASLADTMKITFALIGAVAGTFIWQFMFPIHAGMDCRDPFYDVWGTVLGWTIAILFRHAAESAVS